MRAIDDRKARYAVTIRVNQGYMFYHSLMTFVADTRMRANYGCVPATAIVPIMHWHFWMIWKPGGTLSDRIETESNHPLQRALVEQTTWCALN